MHKVNCGSCRDDITHNIAAHWCIDCHKGYCGECKIRHGSKTVSEDHTLIPIKNYLHERHVCVSLKCTQHEKPLDFFCKSHDTPICLVCVPSNHQACVDVIPITEAAQNVKSSIGLLDVEDDINDTLSEVMRFIHEKDSKIEENKVVTKEIKRHIREIREAINSHLDKLENDIISKLDLHSQKIKTNMELLRKQLTTMQSDLNNIKEKISKLKLFSTDIETFIGMREATKGIIDRKTSVSNLSASSLDFKPDYSINTILDVVERFGKIAVKSTPLNFHERKRDQAQIIIPRDQGLFQSISIEPMLELDIHNTMQCKTVSLSGCTMSPSGVVFIADYHGSGKLLKYTTSGIQVGSVQTIGKPYDVTYLNDNRLAVTFVTSKRIQIINLNDDTRNKTIEMARCCWSIAFDKGKLFIKVEENEICILDCDTNAKTNIKIKGNIASLTASENRVYFTDYKENTVVCCDMVGRKLWTFRDPSLLYPLGISIYKDGNVFVVGRRSDSLHIIKSGGRGCRKILSSEDGLDAPNLVSYLAEHEMLCLGTKKGVISLFYVQAE